MKVSLPKTDVGIRTIFLLLVVKDVFDIFHEEQEGIGLRRGDSTPYTKFTPNDVDFDVRKL